MGRFIQRVREFLIRCLLPERAWVTFSSSKTYPEPDEFHHRLQPENLDPDFLWDVPSLQHRVMTLTFPETIDLKGKRKPELVPKQPWPEGYSVEGDIIDKRDVFFKEGLTRPLSAVFSTSAWK